MAIKNILKEPVYIAQALARSGSNRAVDLPEDYWRFDVVDFFWRRRRPQLLERHFCVLFHVTNLLSLLVPFLIAGSYVFRFLEWSLGPIFRPVSAKFQNWSDRRFATRYVSTWDPAFCSLSNQTCITRIISGYHSLERHRRNFSYQTLSEIRNEDLYGHAEFTHSFILSQPNEETAVRVINALIDRRRRQEEVEEAREKALEEKRKAREAKRKQLLTKFFIYAKPIFTVLFVLVATPVIAFVVYKAFQGVVFLFSMIPWSYLFSIEFIGQAVGILTGAAVIATVIILFAKWAVKTKLGDKIRVMLCKIGDGFASAGRFIANFVKMFTTDSCPSINIVKKDQQ